MWIGSQQIDLFKMAASTVNTSLDEIDLASLRVRDVKMATH